jgi:hypothetical protein
VEVQQQSLVKKNPAKRPGYKGGTGLGMPVPMARKRERAGLRRATAYSQKSTSFFNQLKVNRFFILIKDYTENMSKNWRKKLEKPDSNRQTVMKFHIIIQ